MTDIEVFSSTEQDEASTPSPEKPEAKVSLAGGEVVEAALKAERASLGEKPSSGWAKMRAAQIDAELKKACPASMIDTEGSGD